MPGDGQEFSLFGGPLHRLGCRLGLVSANQSTVKLGLVLGGVPWLVLLLLALFEGGGRELFSVRVIGVHVRLLVLVPLLFVCESALYPRMAAFVDSTLRARAVAEGSRPALESAIVRIRRWKDSWLVDALCLIGAVMVGPLVERAGVMGGSLSSDPAHAIAGGSVTAWWWWNVCMTVARFVLLRWCVRLALWYFFLWRVSRMKLNLLPQHPDGAGGLAGLESVHRQFLAAIVACSAVISASTAEGIIAGTTEFGSIYLTLSVVLVGVVVVFLGPLLMFAPALKAVRMEGNRVFSGFAARYVKEFEKKWLSGADRDEPVLGTPDIQSLADLVNSANALRSMRIVPVSPAILKAYAVGVVVPFLPLLLLKYPIAELIAMIVKKLSGV